jgi:hypothetical protein
MRSIGVGPVEATQLVESVADQVRRSIRMHEMPRVVSPVDGMAPTVSKTMSAKRAVTPQARGEEPHILGWLLMDLSS